MDPFALDPRRAALLIVDLQNDFVREGAPQEVAQARETLPAVRTLIDAVRGAGRPVIYTRYTAGPGDTHQAWFSPECREGVRSCWMGVSRSYHDWPDPLLGHDVVPELAPTTGDIVIDKYGYGSFHNTNLEDVVRALGVDQLWTVGTVTQICVEGTVREGFARGLEMVVVEEGVSSFDPYMHRASLRNMAHKFALVRSMDSLLTELNGERHGSSRTD